MDHNLKLFFVFYVLSCLPWAIASYTYDRQAQWGLFLIDFALTILSYVYLWRAIGWWSLLVLLGLAGFGLFLKGVGLKGYDNLND
jgi:hypothetical protein